MLNQIIWRHTGYQLFKNHRDWIMVLYEPSLLPGLKHWNQLKTSECVDNVIDTILVEIFVLGYTACNSTACNSDPWIQYISRKCHSLRLFRIFSGRAAYLAWAAGCSFSLIHSITEFRTLLSNYPDSQVHGANIGGPCRPQMGPMLAPWTCYQGTSLHNDRLL